MSKIIPENEAGHTTPWLLPQVGSADQDAPSFIASTSHARRQDINTLAIHESAQQEGFRAGYDEGHRAATNEIQSLKQRLESVVTSLEKPFDAINEQVRTELLELALAVAKQILRREIKTDPNHIIGLIREAVKQLPSNTQSILVHLHPDDASTIRETIQDTDHAQHWKIIDDPGLNQGDCQIHTEASFVDASVDALIARLAVEILGGHRDSDETSGKQTRDR